MLMNYHEKGFVHGNLKLNSFQFGSNKYSNKLFFNDLTYSHTFARKNKGSRRELAKSKLELDQFMPFDRMLGYESSRKDDIESIVLLLIYFLKGKLPWTKMVASLSN